jgi:putative aldouronate transport system substrate-binding protein
MKKAKLLCMILAMALVFSVVLSACGGGSDAPSGDAGRELADKYGLPYSGMEDMEPITFTVFSRNSDTPPAADNPVIKAIETITNVKIEYEFLVGDLDTKMGVMIAGGEMPDMVFVGGETGPFIDAGLFLPLNDLIEQNAPNLRAHYAPWWERMKHADGNIYIAEIFGTPVGQEIVMEHWGSAMWIQKDVLDHFGRAPTSLDEYFDFIRQYMAEFPTIDGAPTRGFEILATGFKWIDNPPLFLAGHANWGGVWVDLATDTAHNRFAVDFVKPWLQRLNTEFHNGVVPRDTLTLTQDQYHANIASGAVLGFHDQKWAFNSAQDALRLEGRDSRTYLPLNLTYAGVEPNYVDRRAFTGNNGLGINVNCADPVRLIQYMNYIIQEDVQRFLEWGIKDEHWYYNASGRIERPDEQRVLQQDRKWRVDNLGILLRDLMPKMQGTYSDGNSTDPGSQPEEYFAGMRAYDKELFTRLGILNEAGFMEPGKDRPVYYPVWSMTIEDGSAAKLAEQRRDDVNEIYQSRLITCDPADFDSIWNEYVAAMAGTGIEAYIDEVNRQIGVRKAVAGG